MPGILNKFSRLFHQPLAGRSFVTVNVKINCLAITMLRRLATPRYPCVLAIRADNRHTPEMALDVIQLGLY